MFFKTTEEGCSAGLNGRSHHGCLTGYRVRVLQILRDLEAGTVALRPIEDRTQSADVEHSSD